jgi:hypothetical protein
VYVRENGEQRLLVCLNFSERPCRVALPALAASVVLSTDPARRDTAAGAVDLAASEGLLLELRR